MEARSLENVTLQALQYHEITIPFHGIGQIGIGMYLRSDASTGKSITTFEKLLHSHLSNSMKNLEAALCAGHEDMEHMKTDRGLLAIKLESNTELKTRSTTNVV